MKKLIFLSLAATAALSAGAQGKLDPSAAILASRTLQAEVQSRAGDVKALPAPLAPGDKVAVIVTLAPGEDASSLEARGFEVLTTREDMAIVRMSAAEMYAASEMDQVKSITLGVEARQLLCQAKTYTGVNPIHEGSSEVGGKVYDGTGTIVGLMDSGLDINHPNFLKADGTPRASRLFVITGNGGAISTYDTPSKISAYTTDQSSDTHATHVLGCMAGSFDDYYTKVSFINTSGRNQTSNNRKMNSFSDYRGSATGADIAACCGTTEGTNILLAAEKIYNYAKSQGKPAVMNISLGHNYGPHDGTDANSKYLASIGNDMIICVSAGNEGEENISLHKDFKAGDTQVKTCPSGAASTSGMLDIWGSDATIYKVTFQIIEKATGKVAWSYTLDKNLSSDKNNQNTMAVIASSVYTAPGYIHDDAFDKAFGNSSAVFMMSNIDPNNKRYNVTVQFQTGSGTSGYVPGIVVEGTPGKSVDLFRMGGAMFSNNLAGYSNGNPDCSINGIATAKNIISVGAYVNATKLPTLAGLGTYRDTEGAIATFSSYGKTFDGRQLPLVAGPGQGVISSYSSYYTATLDSKDPSIAQATAYVDRTVSNRSRRYYWAEMSGTSMSSPFVAGVISLWLQADPTLKYNDILNVINTTSTKDALTAAAPDKFGAGRINALAGIKKILNLTGISDVKVDGDNFVVTPTFGRGFEVFAAGARSVSAELYSMSGALVARADASGDTAVLDASAAAPGVYVLRSATANGRVDSRKVVLK